MKGTIRAGATVFQDFKVFGWPIELSEIVFDVEETDNRFRCVAKGYGERGYYGNGAVFVRRKEDIEEVKDGKSYKSSEVPILITPEELKELSRKVANMGFDEGLRAGVEMVRVTAVLHPDKAEFLMDLAAKMESSLED